MSAVCYGANKFQSWLSSTNLDFAFLSAPHGHISSILDKGCLKIDSFFCKLPLYNKDNQITATTITTIRFNHQLHCKDYSRVDLEKLDSQELQLNIAVQNSVGRSASSENENIIPFTAHGLEKVCAGPDSVPILILPGFGNCTSDYSNALGLPEASLELSLRSRGFLVETVQVDRKDWFLGILAGVFTRGFWSKTCTTKESYDWYMARVDQAIEQILSKYPNHRNQVDLVAHSAGGWLARAYLGGVTNTGSQGSLARKDTIRKLITLGTPHILVPKTDPTRGAVEWVNSTWPDAFFADHGVEYITVAGRSVIGCTQTPIRDKNRKRNPARYASTSYATVIGGSGHGIQGDAVVPLQSALALKGAKQIILDGVWHSMSRLGTFDTPSSRPWYGSDQVVDAWLSLL